MSALLWILALMWPVLFIAVATHELAHTVTARLLGIPVRSVDIGAGQEVAAMTVAGIRVSLRRRPSGGFTDADLSAARSRWHVIATVAAGPAVNAIEAVALQLIGRVAPGTPRDMAAALGAAIGLVAILQVIPNQDNDGALIIRALRGHTVQEAGGGSPCR